MSQPHPRYDTTFIDTSGGILTEQLVHKLREQQCSEDAVKPTTFALDGDGPTTQTEFEAEVTEAWESLKERWDSLSQNNEIFSLDTSGIRDQWTIPLLKGLGFNPVYQQSNLEADGIDANLSHLGWTPAGQLTASGYDGEPPILHLVQPDDEPAHTLDSGAHAGSGSSGRSPHDELQRFLNAADQQWSVVTDGLKLRVLRDYYHTYTRGYVEFDLESIFTNRNCEDFRALYRLCHASRFIESDESEAPLEQLYQVAVSTGVKIGEDLQSNVVEALETLGNGFLNPELREELAEGDQDVADAYFQDLLRIVYRLLFLLFAEQRGMMADRGDLYTDEYSITALRDRSERHSTVRDTETDLWEGLQVTFKIVGEGTDAERLSVTGYNGSLFDDDELTYLRDASNKTELDTDVTCPNEALLSVVHDLTHVKQDGYPQRISYADLGVDEIGAVYESLLEFTPRYATEPVESGDLSVQSNQFYLDDRGMDRKETGSYYTKPDLVAELIDSTLEPVVEERIDESQSRSQQEAALLDIDVCDPACGSGAFLIAANNFLAKRLAKIRSDTAYPSQAQLRQARRSVVQHCIYGVDLNPMAVELAKVSLWINSAVGDEPLSFLDHRIRHGNSLIGVTKSDLSNGIPYEAYEKTEGREGHPGTDVRSDLRKINKELGSGGVQTGIDWEWADTPTFVSKAQELDETTEQSIQDVQHKQELLTELQSSSDYQIECLARDIWAAAFFWDLLEHPETYPTTKTIQEIRRSSDPATFTGKRKELEEIASITNSIAERESFFHWDIEFPLVWHGEDPGFDVILGNPPWEEVREDATEFFAVSHPSIANASRRDRPEMIEELAETDPELHAAWRDEQFKIRKRKHFFNNSPTTQKGSIGKTNTYPLFTFVNSELTNAAGRAGFIVKTAIATNHDYSSLFRELVTDGRVISLYDFENVNGYFPGVHRQERFCLLTLSGSAVPDRSSLELLFNLHSVNDIPDKEPINMKLDVLETLSAGSYQLPALNSNQDLKIIQEIAKPASNKAFDQDESDWNLDWGFLADGGDIQDIAYIREELQGDSGHTIYETANDGTDVVGVYEGRYVSTFDHRNRSFAGVEKDNRFGRALGKQPSSGEKSSPSFEIQPRYWIDKSEVEQYYTGIDWPADWLYLYGRKTKDTNRRTFMGAITPRVGSTDTAPYLLPSSGTTDKERAERTLTVAAITNSFVFDYQARNYISGTTLGKNSVLRMTAPQFSHIADQDDLFDKLKTLALRLSCTSESVSSISQYTNTDNFQKSFDESERQEMMYELNAIVAVLYQLEEETLEYILDSFTMIQEAEDSESGSFATKERILEHFSNYNE
jgi:hypothetical protein